MTAASNTAQGKTQVPPKPPPFQGKTASSDEGRGVGSALHAENMAVAHEIAWEIAAIARALPGMAPTSGDAEDTPFLVRGAADRLHRLSGILMQLLDAPEAPVGDLAREAFLIEES